MIPEKQKIHCDDFQKLVYNFYEKVRNKYMEIEGIGKEEFLYRAKMGVVKSESVFPMMPQGLQMQDIPNSNDYDIQYTDFSKNKGR